MDASATPRLQDEPGRLRAVQRHDILDTPPDGAFDRVASLAARIFDVPIATVSIVDHDRIWFKAVQGLDVTEVSREPGLCASAILQKDPYVVTDASTDPRCFDNELVRGELGVRFYAGAPIRTRDGHNLGTLNVISGQPRDVSPRELGMLEDLADVVSDQLEIRLGARRTIESERAQRLRAEELTDVLQRRLLPQHSAPIPGAEVATYYRPATSALDIGGDFLDVFETSTGTWGLAIGDVCGKGPEAAAVTGEIRSTLRGIAHVAGDPRAVLTSLNEVLCRDGLDDDVDTPSELFCTASLVCLGRDDAGLTATVGTAGHPLALLRRANGAVEHFGVPGQLLGQFPSFEVTNATTELREGDMMLLYTDGAVEQRGMSIEHGERALTEAMRSAPADSADAALGHIRKAVEELHDEFDDDIAFVLVRVCGSRP